MVLGWTIPFAIILSLDINNERKRVSEWNACECDFMICLLKSKKIIENIVLLPWQSRACGPSEPTRVSSELDSLLFISHVYFRSRIFNYFLDIVF